jgi:transaldolase
MRKESIMSQQGVSKDVLNAVKKANQKTMQDGAELRKLIDKVSKMVNIPVSNETTNEIIKAVKKSGSIEQLENIMKMMMKK